MTRILLFVFFLFALGTPAFSQEKQKAAVKPDLPPKLNAQWEKAEKAVAENRKKYLQANQKVLDDFAKQVARLDPQANAKDLSEKFKAVVMTDAEEVEVPVLGKDIFVAPNGHKYKLFDENLSWHDAKKMCEDEGGHLWVIDSPQEHALIRQLLKPVVRPGNDHFWLGGSKNEKGSWVWLNGQAVPNIGREAHFPVGDGGKDVMAMNGGGSLINERPHNHPGMRFICEWDK